jgi:hypothetical protein
MRIIPGEPNIARCNSSRRCPNLVWYPSLSQSLRVVSGRMYRRTWSALKLKSRANNRFAFFWNTSSFVYGCSVYSRVSQHGIGLNIHQGCCR